ncbi:hypothetical protein DPEC_G00113010 [Dallia pectoralis]|uniref:Uncharacterized protein n=1 Tax=Dallia pectoralis TaxID=75939 RepID=A0ACC2GUC1_DALPE|nr:hypothetical protein DPEC_G00113010 [Dallia pectoralis]
MEKECQSARPKTSRCQRLTIQLVIPSASGDAIDDSLSRKGSSIFFLDDSEPACYERVSSLELQEKTVLEKTNTTLAFDAPKQAQASLLKKLRSLFIKTNRNSLYPTSLADNKLPIIPEETIEEMMDVLASDVEMPPKKSLWKRLKTIFRWKKNATVKALLRFPRKALLTPISTLGWGSNKGENQPPSWLL